MPGSHPGHPDPQGSIEGYFFRLSRLRYPTIAAIRLAVEAINFASAFLLLIGLNNRLCRLTRLCGAHARAEESAMENEEAGQVIEFTTT